MRLVRKTGWQQRELDLVQIGQMILCKVWKVWMLLGPSRRRTRELLGIIYEFNAEAGKHHGGVLGW